MVTVCDAPLESLYVTVDGAPFPRITPVWSNCTIRPTVSVTVVKPLPEKVYVIVLLLASSSRMLVLLNQNVSPFSDTRRDGRGNDKYAKSLTQPPPVGAFGSTEEPDNCSNWGT